MREWEIGAVENIHGALPYIRFAPILALVGVGVNRIGKVCSIHDEVIGPDVIGPARPQTDAGSVVGPQPAPFRLLLWELQPLPPPDALDPLGVHVPTFGPEQGSDPPIAISAILAGQAMIAAVSASSSSRPRGLLRWVERCWPATAQARRSEIPNSAWR